TRRHRPNGLYGWNSKAAAASRVLPPCRLAPRAFQVAQGRGWVTWMPSSARARMPLTTETLNSGRSSSMELLPAVRDRMPLGGRSIVAHADGRSRAREGEYTPVRAPLHPDSTAASRRRSVVTLPPPRACAGRRLRLVDAGGRGAHHPEQWSPRG